MANSSPQVRRLTPDDAAAYAALRAAMLAESPLAFSSSPERDLFVKPEGVREFLAKPGCAILGAFQGETLVGAAGLMRDPQPKLAHRAMVWGVWVAPANRGQGAGEALLRAAVGAAGAWESVCILRLAVGVGQAAARRLYERVGFAAWGTEPDTLLHEGAYHDEVYMQLRFR